MLPSKRKCSALPSGSRALISVQKTLASGHQQGPAGTKWQHHGRSGMVATCRCCAWRQPDTGGGRQIRWRPRLGRPCAAGGGRRNAAITGWAAAATLQVNQGITPFAALVACGNLAVGGAASPAALCSHNLQALHTSTKPLSSRHLCWRLPTCRVSANADSARGWLRRCWRRRPARTATLTTTPGAATCGSPSRSLQVCHASANNEMPPATLSTPHQWCQVSPAVPNGLDSLSIVRRRSWPVSVVNYIMPLQASTAPTRCRCPLARWPSTMWWRLR